MTGRGAAETYVFPLEQNMMPSSSRGKRAILALEAKEEQNS